MYNERHARTWSQADAIKAMRAHSAKELPSTSSLLRQYKRWEAGEVTPSEFYQPVMVDIDPRKLKGPSTSGRL